MVSKGLATRRIVVLPSSEVCRGRFFGCSPSPIPYLLKLTAFLSRGAVTSFSRPLGSLTGGGVSTCFALSS
jgi:hypothetical protein